MQTRAIEVAMSVTNILLKRVWLFIDAMSVHSHLKCFQIYKNIFFIFMVNWRCLWLLSFGLSFAKKFINSFTNNTWSTCYESCLCWLNYNKCRCGCCSGWCACCWWRRNQRHTPSKKWFCFFGALETYVIGGNQPTDENQSIDLLHFMQDEKDQIQKIIMERVAEGPRKLSS